MEKKTKNKLALFVSNAQVIRGEFRRHNAMTKRLAALIYAQENKPIDTEKIERCYALMKQNTGLFSSFRGNMSLCIATMLSLSPDPQGMFDKTLQVYGMLKASKLRSSDYLAVTAFQIASQTEPANYQNAVDRTREFYDAMKKRNFFITGQDDYIFAAMFALSDIGVASGTDRIAEIIKRLKGEFWSKYGIQTVAQILALSNSCDDAVSRVLSLRDALKAQRIRLDKEYTLPTLGTLAILPVDCNTIVADIAEGQQVLREQKGFGSWSVTKQELLIYVAAVTASEHAKNTSNDVVTATVSTSITNIIIAQQVAMMMAVIMATSVAASTAAASS